MQPAPSAQTGSTRAHGGCIASALHRHSIGACGQPSCGTCGPEHPWGIEPRPRYRIVCMLTECAVRATQWRGEQRNARPDHWPRSRPRERRVPRSPLGDGASSGSSSSVRLPAAMRAVVRAHRARSSRMYWKVCRTISIAPAMESARVRRSGAHGWRARAGWA